MTHIRIYTSAAKNSVTHSVLHKALPIRPSYLILSFDFKVDGEARSVLLKLNSTYAPAEGYSQGSCRRSWRCPYCCASDTHGVVREEEQEWEREEKRIKKWKLAFLALTKSGTRHRRLRPHPPRVALFLLQFSPRRVKRSPSRCGQVTLLAERRLRQIEEVNDDTHLAGTLMCGGCPRSAGAFGTRTFHTVRNVCLKCAPATKPLFFMITKSLRTNRSNTGTLE